jgi:hypothetical protein
MSVMAPVDQIKKIKWKNYISTSSSYCFLQWISKALKNDDVAGNLK